MPAFIGVHHINLSVADLERSAAWYRKVLRLEEGWDIDDVEGRGRKKVLTHPGTAFRIVLSLHQSNDGSRFSEFKTGLDHVAFSIADRPQLDLWQAWFDEHDVEHSEIKEGATGWLITFRDLDNIQFEMYTVSK
jgi:glyoxylase I family protein